MECLLIIEQIYYTAIVRMYSGRNLNNMELLLEIEALSGSPIFLTAEMFTFQKATDTGR